MKQQKWIIAPVVLALALGTAGLSMAQPPADGAETPRAGKQGKRNRAEKGQRNAKAAWAAAVPSPQVLERVLGRPLTNEQRKAVDEAAQIYMENVARAVGLTPEELKAQLQKFRAAQREARKQGRKSAHDGGTTTPAQDQEN